MNNFRRVGITLLALSMGLGGIASAQDRDRDRDRGPPDRSDRQAERRAQPDRNDHHAERRAQPDHSDRHHRDDRSHRDGRHHRNDGPSRWDHHDNGPRHHVEQYAPRANHGYNQRDEWRDQRGEWRGAGPRHDFRRGDYLTPQYRHRQYVVENWRGHHLSAPPRGYHWVQTGGDYVLVAIATGLILQILLGQ